ncbi:hypothetical protein BO94DRAFT_30494 [Aspergillus sclerotioniger CBS 115572]|uniref:Uncharacterized protein n=1 Tax=Aspergillus sclerotioniger CBS 115572 TaxID=1450535 RepID=A0A317WZ03_9EURO|nr:hypothetical protein BO94DRAFT_30494 [Aspergillus sclerotioniger CBS 115572]PWY90562.1 hypothetical protein BO94DRAFT_30494 [Aspergillus sclerotioniger CBS 115572]
MSGTSESVDFLTAYDLITEAFPDIIGTEKHSTGTGIHSVSPSIEMAFPVEHHVAIHRLIHRLQTLRLVNGFFCNVASRILFSTCLIYFTTDQHHPFCDLEYLQRSNNASFIRNLVIICRHPANTTPTHHLPPSCDPNPPSQTLIPCQGHPIPEHSRVSLSSLEIPTKSKSGVTI